MGTRSNDEVSEDAACAMMMAYAISIGVRFSVHDSLETPLTPDQRKKLERKWREINASPTQQ